MNATTILHEAEQRIGAANAQAHEVTEQGIDRLRQDIGRATYERAKEQLVVLERLINERVLPFAARTTAIAQHVTDPLPPQIKQMLSELSECSHSAPQRLRSGIEHYRTLRVPLLPDGRPDPNACRTVVYSIRQELNSWDGWRTRFDYLMAQVAGWIKEVGWPRGGMPAIAPLAPESRPPVTGIQVEKNFVL